MQFWEVCKGVDDIATWISYNAGEHADVQPPPEQPLSSTGLIEGYYLNASCIISCCQVCALGVDCNLVYVILTAFNAGDWRLI